MAFSTKRELRIVPWSSLDEWHTVYEQIYSNDIEEQKKAYETLLVWKARIPKLPAGIDCTLGLLEVCLRDRDWTAKIEKGQLPIHYEHDLQKMYSTAIMRFLNHICNLKNTKNSSIVKICNSMNIPDWVINLRHDAAHSHNLPPLESQRNATNLLLAWIHNEYWAAELKRMENLKEAKKREKAEIEDMIESFKEKMELWIATGLYIKAGYELVHQIPNDDLKKSLEEIVSTEGSNSRSDKLDRRKKNDTNKEHRKASSQLNMLELISAQSIILSALTNLLKNKYKSMNRCSNIILDFLFETDIFLPNADNLKMFTEEEHIKELPDNFLAFWKDLILYLQEKKLLTRLFVRLHNFVLNESMNKSKRHMASLWMHALILATMKQNVTQTIILSITEELDAKNMPFKKKFYTEKIETFLKEHHPKLVNVLSLKCQSNAIACLKDENYLKDLIIEVNEFSINYAVSALDLMENLQKKQRKKIKDAFALLANGPREEDIFDGKIYSIEDLQINDESEHNDEDDETDSTVRNTTWHLATDNVDWKNYPIGIVPGQNIANTAGVSSVVVMPNDKSHCSPGFLQDSEKSMESQINWDKIIKRKKNKRKHGAITNKQPKKIKGLKKKKSNK